MKIEKNILIFLSFTSLFLAVFSYLYIQNMDTLYLTLLMFTPAVSVLLTKLITHESTNRKQLIMALSRKNKKYLIMAYFGTSLLAFGGAMIYFILFPNDFDPLHSILANKWQLTGSNSYFSQLAVMIPLAILINPIGGLLQCFGEEFAWRGFLLPALTKSLGQFKAVLLSGFIWGIWHAPIILTGFNYGSEHPLLGVCAMIIFCMTISGLTSWFYFKTGSIWPSVFFHASLNAIDKFKPSQLFMNHQANPFIGPDLIGIIGGSLLIVVSLICIYSIYKNSISQSNN